MTETGKILYLLSRDILLLISCQYIRKLSITVYSMPLHMLGTIILKIMSIEYMKGGFMAVISLSLKQLTIEVIRTCKTST